MIFWLNTEQYFSCMWLEIVKKFENFDPRHMSNAPVNQVRRKQTTAADEVDKSFLFDLRQNVDKKEIARDSAT